MKISIYCILFYIYLRPIQSVIKFDSVQLKPEDYNKTWMYFSNGSDLPEVVLLTEPPNSERAVHGKSLNNIRFELYTRRNIKVPYFMSSILPSKTSGSAKTKRDIQIDESFDNSLNTKIIVHGWKSSTLSDTIQAIKNEYLKEGSYNIIAVDWEQQASTIYYWVSVGYTKTVGRTVANLVDYLVEEKNVNANTIHLIGHSLGAHIMGYAGSYSKHRISRITGLDPASPFFEGEGTEKRLDVTDAEFVDVIHSCAGVLGYKQKLGHVDFYPNGGSAPQPGCGAITYILQACSHGRSHRYFAESINSKKGFYAYPCGSIEDFEKNLCTKNPILMGDKVPTNAKGIYYLKTNEKPEFALGNKMK